MSGDVIGEGVLKRHLSFCLGVIRLDADVARGRYSGDGFFCGGRECPQPEVKLGYYWLLNKMMGKPPR